MNSKDFLKEGFIEDASDVHMDHEVQMAREECYHAAEHALAIHKLLRNISEQQGLEGWVSSKITLANDYLNTVREHLEYELLQPQIDDAAIGMPIAENEQQGVAEGIENTIDSMSIEELEQFVDEILPILQQLSKQKSKTAKDQFDKLKKQYDAALEKIYDVDSMNESTLQEKFKSKQGVAEGHADQQRKIFKKNGKPVGEVGIDRESSPGVGQWYMKCYLNGIDNAGYDSYQEAVAELKHCLKQGVAEGAKCNQTMEGKSCPVHGLQECPGMKARALAEWKKIQRTKKLKEQGITDQEIRQRIQPTFQATDAQINDPEWMRSRGLIPMQDIERDYKDTLEKENYTDAVAKAASQGLPVFQHKGQTYATKNPDYNKYYTDKDPGHSKGGEPMALNKQQTHQLAGTNIVSGSGAPVIAGSKMLKPNPNTSGVNETTAGSVAGVVNPKSNKPKSKIGSLFGGTYQQTRKSK